MKRLLYLALLLIAPSIHAQIINANSCSQADVQAAFNAVTASTTTVNIPSCTGSWTGQVLLNVPSGSTSLTVHGNSTTSGTCAPPATTCPATDNTIIQDNDTVDSSSVWIITTAGASSFFRLTGITLQGGTGGVKNNGALMIGGFSQNFRLDHNHFNGQTYSSPNNGNLFRTVGWIYGVADHNDFAMESIQNSISTWMDSYGNNAAGFGDNAWAAPTNFGGSNFFFLENNLFETPTTNKYGPPNDCSHGGRFVFRYNIMQGTALQTHPTGGSGRARGCRAWEIYNNSAVGVNSGGGALADFNFMFASSGTGLIWGNTITGTGSGTGSGYTNFTSIHSDRIDATTYTESPVPNGWGYCGPSSGLSGDESPWDPNPTTTGYPCLDQPGTGIGDQLQGQFPNACDVTSGQCAIPNFNGSNTHQAHEPVYDWMNSWAVTSGAGGQYWSNSQPTVLSNNTDYYLWCNASSPTGCTSFTGAAGVGTGVLASRPSTCTKGVAYWGTDTQTLYQCNATNTWSTYYTPYTYPHPLVNGTPSASTPTFSPVAGTYTGTQSVIITAATGGAICYTTNGTAPHTNGATGCSAGTLYSGAVSVAASGTLEAVAGGTGFSDSAPGTAAYVIRTTASTPTFSPVAGTYAGMQSVTISSTGSVICYTTNGSTPATNGGTGCTTGTLYTAALSVASSETLKAVGGGSAFIDSSVASAAYVITTGAATPTFSPGAGTYPSTQSVTLATATGGAVICYTIDGSTPATNGSTGCTTGTLYGSAISVATSETLKAVAGGTGHTDSSVGSAVYVIKKNSVAPVSTPSAGTYTSGQSVTLSTTSSGAIICFTTNGSTPATNGTTGCGAGTLYSTAIAVPASITIRAITGGTGYNDSTVTTAIYTIRIAAAQPTFSPGAGTYTGMQTVTISTTSAGPFVICYNTTGSPVTDGNAGCTTGTIYTGPVSITSSQTLFAVVGGPGYNDSPVGSAAFVIRTQTQTPTFTPPAGPYVMPITATISVPSPDSAAPLTVCYAVSATCVPGSTGTPYTCASTPCNITVQPPISEQICAIATTPGLSPSAVACSGLYTTSTAATGDGRGVQTEPQYPAALLAGGCTKVAATQTVATTTALNVDPWNPTSSPQGSITATGGTSLEPASETLDTTLMTAINNTSPGGCVEVTQGTSGRVGLVEGKWAPVTTKGAGGGVKVIQDPGTTIYASRNAATYQPSDPSCGTFSLTASSSCDPWITVSDAPGAAIMGPGVLDGRCWDVFTGGGNGFCSQKLKSYCLHPNRSHEFGGVTCSGSQTSTSQIVANGPNMMNWKGPCTNCNNILYKTILNDSGQFNVNIENGLSGMTVWGIGIYGAAEVSNSDGIDEAYCVSNVTVAFNNISMGDNHDAFKASSSKGGGCATQAITLDHNQTGAGIGITMGFESTASSGPGITNILVTNTVQQGSNNNPGQQVGHGVHSGNGEGGSVTNVTFENTCISNEASAALLYDMSDSGSYSGVQDINLTMLGSPVVNFQGASGRVNTINLNNVTGTLGGHTYNQTTFNGLNVSFAPSGTGVTNNITNPGGNTPFPCTSTTWQPIQGDLSAQIGGQSLYSTYTTASSSQALKLEVVIRPRTAINTQESTALTQPVAFYDNGSLLGTAAIGGNGTYAFYSTTATNGSHTYTARYSGDSGYPGVVYNFGSVTVQVGSSAPTIVGPTQFQGTVVVQ